MDQLINIVFDLFCFLFPVQGSHDELMALDGKYAEMFRMQAEKYKG